MKQCRLQRTGEPWLAFEGELIAQSNGQWAAGKEQKRWHDLRLYRTAGGEYVVHVVYRTTRGSELNYSWAKVAAADEFAHVLRSYEPEINVEGFAALLARIRRRTGRSTRLARRYGVQVTELLRDVAALDERVE